MVSSAPEPTRRLLRHDRLLVAGSLALLALLAWLYLLAGAGLAPMTAMPMAPPPFVAVVAMWWLMMVAMMLPAAAPMVLLYAEVRRREQARGHPLAATGTFLAGYLAIWLGFSLVAALAQRLATGPAMRLADPRTAGVILLAAGLYQWSPWKGVCLDRCRAPAAFLSHHWRGGRFGALRLGLLHGAYCLGCCWLLMALLFVGGIMNLALVAALAVLVAAEKLLPGGPRIARGTGALLVVSGLVLLVR